MIHSCIIHSHFRDCERGVFLSCDWLWDDEGSFTDLSLADRGGVTRWLDQWEVATQWLGEVPLPAWISSPPPSLSLSLSTSLHLAPSVELAVSAFTSPKRGLPGHNLQLKLFLFNNKWTRLLARSGLRCWGWSFWPHSLGSPGPVMCSTIRMTISKVRLETMNSSLWNSSPLGESF